MQENDSSPIFQSEAWLAACARAIHGRVRSVPGIDGLRLLERRIGPFKVAGAPLPKSATPMTAGLHGTQDEVAMHLAALASWFPKSGLSLLQVTSPWPLPDNIHASRVEHLRNMEINLAGDCSEIWSRVSTLPRRMIRKAVKAGIRVHCADPAGSQLAIHREISTQMFSAQGEAPIVRPAQYDAISTPPLKNCSRLFIASKDSRILGGLITLFDDTQACYWDVAIRPEARAIGVGHLLFWTWLRWCKRNGISRLDLMGPPEGGRAGGRAGIGRFKASFGAIPVDYHVIYWHSAAAGHALNLSRWLAERRRSSKLTS